MSPDLDKRTLDGGASHLASLNPAQRRAVEYGVSSGAPGPLLVIAGAGTGKTQTLAHRVAHLILHGADPRRMLLLTFTRRAAHEMTRRAERIVAGALASAHQATVRADAARVRWSGTFHAVGNRLLRLHAEQVGLDPAFTVLDRSDAADLLDLVRDSLGQSARAARFPKKATCLAIYSHTVNAQCPLEETLERAFPWCASWADDLRALFGGYVETKQRQHVLDYDDLLLYWHHLMEEPALAQQVGQRFDHVLVDEYQDTNALQAGILYRLRPNGAGMTVVGDDAQAIYSFRAATVRNILDFPTRFAPPAAVVTLEQNYRSTEPILEAANAVMSLAPEGFAKRLFSARASRERPVLAALEDETAQVEYVVERVLGHREAGIALQRQAVLMRAAHHSAALEIELAHRNIPFVKFGGLKFLEAAHVKDVVSVLRWVENPRDLVAAFRVLQLLPGVGPRTARAVVTAFEAAGSVFGALSRASVPPAAMHDWSRLCDLLVRLRDARTEWHAQLGMVRQWYAPHLERLYDAAPVRAGDLDQLEQIAGVYPTRERFLSELALDPPDASGDEAGPPLLDEDYLILSTIHSAKGQEWDAVYVLNVVDGCIPSDMATGRPEEIDEERRLLYVAMTRARDHLYLLQPLRFHTRQHRFSDHHVYVPRSRFLPDETLPAFDRQAHGATAGADSPEGPRAARVDIGARLRAMWAPAPEP